MDASEPQAEMQVVRKVIKVKTSVQSMNKAGTLAKCISWAFYRVKMSSFTRLANHSKQLRLFRDIGRRLVSNLDKHFSEMRKLAIMLWRKNMHARKQAESFRAECFARAFAGITLSRMESGFGLVRARYLEMTELMQRQISEIRFTESKSLTRPKRSTTALKPHLHNLNRILSHIVFSRLSRYFLAIKQARRRTVDLQLVLYISELISIPGSRLGFDQIFNWASARQEQDMLRLQEQWLEQERVKSQEEHWVKITEAMARLRNKILTKQKNNKDFAWGMIWGKYIFWKEECSNKLAKLALIFGSKLRQSKADFLIVAMTKLKLNNARKRARLAYKPQRQPEKVIAEKEPERPVQRLAERKQQKPPSPVVKQFKREPQKQNPKTQSPLQKQAPKKENINIKVVDESPINKIAEQQSRVERNPRIYSQAELVQRQNSRVDYERKSRMEQEAKAYQVQRQIPSRLEHKQQELNYQGHHRNSHSPEFVQRQPEPKPKPYYEEKQVQRPRQAQSQILLHERHQQQYSRPKTPKREIIQQNVRPSMKMRGGEQYLRAGFQAGYRVKLQRNSSEGRMNHSLPPAPHLQFLLMANKNGIQPRSTSLNGRMRPPGPIPGPGQVGPMPFKIGNLQMRGQIIRGRNVSNSPFNGPPDMRTGLRASSPPMLMMQGGNNKMGMMDMGHQRVGPGPSPGPGPMQMQGRSNSPSGLPGGMMLGPRAIQGRPNSPINVMAGGHFGMQGMQGMQGMHRMQGMQVMQGMQGMKGMHGMHEMRGTQGMHGMQGMHIQGMHGLHLHGMQGSPISHQTGSPQNSFDGGLMGAGLRSHSPHSMQAMPGPRSKSPSQGSLQKNVSVGGSLGMGMAGMGMGTEARHGYEGLGRMGQGPAGWASWGRKGRW